MLTILAREHNYYNCNQIRVHTVSANICPLLWFHARCITIYVVQCMIHSGKTYFHSLQDNFILSYFAILLQSAQGCFLLNVKNHSDYWWSWKHIHTLIHRIVIFDCRIVSETHMGFQIVSRNLPLLPLFLQKTEHQKFGPA